MFLLALFLYSTILHIRPVVVVVHSKQKATRPYGGGGSFAYAYLAQNPITLGLII